MTLAEKTDISASEHPVPVILDSRVVYAEVSRALFSYDIAARPSFELVCERADGYWLVRDVGTGIFGQGADILEATRDFDRASAEHLDFLERQSALSDELRSQLEYLRARVRT